MRSVLRTHLRRSRWLRSGSTVHRSRTSRLARFADQRIRSRFGLLRIDEFHPRWRWGRLWLRSICHRGATRSTGACGLLCRRCRRLCWGSGVQDRSRDNVFAITVGLWTGKSLSGQRGADMELISAAFTCEPNLHERRVSMCESPKFYKPNKFMLFAGRAETQDWCSERRISRCIDNRIRRSNLSRLNVSRCRGFVKPILALDGKMTLSGFSVTRFP